MVSRRTLTKLPLSMPHHILRRRTAPVQKCLWILSSPEIMQIWADVSSFITSGYTFIRAIRRKHIVSNALWRWAPSKDLLDELQSLFQTLVIGIEELLGNAWDKALVDSPSTPFVVTYIKTGQIIEDRDRICQIEAILMVFLLLDSESFLIHFPIWESHSWPGSIIDKPESRWMQWIEGS